MATRREFAAADLEMNASVSASQPHRWRAPPPGSRVRPSRSGAFVCRYSTVVVAVMLGILTVYVVSTNQLISSLQQGLRTQQDAKQRVSPAPTPPPENCYLDRDNGLFEVIKQHALPLCGTSPSESTTIVHYKPPSVRMGLDGTLVRHFALDLRKTSVYKPITDLSKDGIGHDPRFHFDPHIPLCACADAQLEKADKERNVWLRRFGQKPNKYVIYPICHVVTAEYLASLWQDSIEISSGQLAQDSSKQVVRMDGGKTIVVARRDDHNPFFQFSAVMDAWIMMRVLGWQAEETQLVYLDDGIPSPTDEYQKRMLSPKKPVIHGKNLLGKVVLLDEALIAPFEDTGPMMTHLNDHEPCGRSQLFVDFREASLKAMDVALTKKDPESCRLTIISRRPYDGRVVQRVWLNEDEAVAAMQELLKDGKKPHRNGQCTLQSLDFVKLTLTEQMHEMVNSDFVIGMHGAGMGNVVWTRPGTTVLEIFPHKKERWGFRNLCQFVGCDWHQFRGGKDTGLGDGASDKTIPVQEWMAFFEPIFDAAMTQSAGTSRSPSIG